MPLNVLVVEDSQDDALLEIRRLESAGWDVEWRQVSSRSELEEALDERRWDVLLVDYMLPGFGGREALAVVGERGLDLPFIIVSGKIGEEVAAEAIHAGAQDFVSKDNLARLPAVVARELREAESRWEHRQAEKAIQLQAAALRAAANAVLITDAEGHIEWVNRAFSELSCLGEEEVLGETQDLTIAAGTMTPEASTMRAAALAAGHPWSGERVLRRKDGALVTVLETATPLMEGDRVSRVIVIQEDISWRLAAEARIYHLAHHDPLTDLPNRLLFHDRLERACARAARGGRSFAVVAFDLDYFKYVNDLHGHLFGDAVLREVAMRLAANVRAADTVSRVGGDEFSALLVDIDRPKDVARVTAAMLAALSEPLEIDGRQIQLSAAAGIALFPPNGRSADDMLRSADIALFRAKHAGGAAYAFFSPEMEADVEKHVAREQGLREALDQNTLLVEYEPEVDLRTGRVVVAEALVSCGDSSREDLAVAAESSGLSLRLDEWALRRACSQALCWQNGDPLVPRVAVRIHELRLRGEELARLVESILRETGLPADRLELEFTERALERDLGQTRRLLTELRDLGVHLSITNFGTGHSSLGSLGSLPLERLKIDSSFVRGIGADPRKERIVVATIALAHSLGMRASAEGIESAPQLDFLRANECDEAQGFLVGPTASRLLAGDVARS